MRPFLSQRSSEMGIAAATIIAAFATACLALAAGQSVLFPDSGQYVYSFTASVSAGSVLPKRYESLYVVKGYLGVQKSPLSIDHIVKLSSIKHTLFNSESSEYQFKDVSTEAEFLELPFLMNIRQEGIIGSLNFTKDDPLWSTNIKRAIAAHLQMQTIGRPLPGAFKLSEPCIHGVCIVEYSSSDGVNVRKSNSVPTLVPSPTHDLWMSVMPDPCTKDTKNPLIGSADRWYTMDEKGLLKMVSEGTIEVHYHNHVFRSVTNVTLERAHITYEAIPSQSSYPKQSSVAFKPPEGAEPTGGRAPLTATDQLDQLWNILGMIADGLEQPGLTDTLLKDKLPLRLQEILSTMSHATLEKAHEELELGTSYKWETMKNIFLEVLPQVKSNAAVMLVRDLVVKNKIYDEFIALQLLRRIPFNAANLDQDLLAEMEPLLKISQEYSQLVRHTGILSFSTLVFKTFIRGACTTDVFEHYMQMYFSRFTESSDYADRLVWLSGLSNLQMEHVTSYLMPVIAGTLGHSTNERFLSVWATINRCHLYKTEVHNVYWPILHNPAEPLQMRIAAITMLLTSDPTPHRLLSLHWYISSPSQTDQHIKQFFYTTIKSLERTTFDCYKHLAKLASYLGKIVKPPRDHRKLWATGNYLLDVADDSRDMGFMMQAVSIGNELTGLPEVFYFTLVTQNAGLIVQDYGIYIKMQGVMSNFLHKLHGMSSDALELTQLLNALRQLKVQPQTIQPVHVELLIKYQGKIMYSLHLNQTMFNKWSEGDFKKAIDSIVQAESHINQQFLIYPTILKSTLPSELGTPVITDTMLSSLTSIRGNLTHALNDEEITRRNDVHMRTSTLALISLSAYNPIANVHHAAEVAQVSDAYFPANFSASISMLMRNFRMTWLKSKSGQSPGFLAYSGSKVSIVSQKVHINDFCSTCTNEMINMGNQSAKFTVFGMNVDCNGPTSLSEIFWQIITSHKSNANVLPFAKPMLIVLHGLVLGAVPAKGPCKISASTPKSEIAKKTDFEFAVMTTSGTSEKLHITAGLVTKNDDESQRSIELFNMSSIIEWNDNKIKMAMKSTGKMSPESEEIKICLEAEETYTKLEDQLMNNKLVGAHVAFAIGNSSEKCPIDGLWISMIMKLNETASSRDSFDVHLTVKNIPENVASTVSKYNNAWDIFAPKYVMVEYGVAKFLLNEFSKQNADLNASVVVSEDRADIVLKSEDTSISTTWKDNNYFLYPRDQLHFFKEIGLIKECYIKANKLIDVNENEIELASSINCELLAVAECTNSPKFVILRLPSADGLAIKFFIEDSHIVIQPTPNNITVLVNDQEINWTPSYQYPQHERFYVFKITGTADKLIIESKINVLKVIYRRTQAVIVVPSIHLFNSCGACIQSQTLHTKC